MQLFESEQSCINYIPYSPTVASRQQRFICFSIDAELHKGARLIPMVDFNFFIFWSWKVVVCWEKNDATRKRSHLLQCLRNYFHCFASADWLSICRWRACRCVCEEHLSGAVHENLSRAIRRTEIYELVHFESSLRRESLLMDPLLRCEMWPPVARVYRKKWEEFGRK